MAEHDDQIAAAVERVRELERSAEESHALYMRYADEVTRLRQAIRKSTDALSELRRNPDRSRQRDQQLEAELTARRDELNRTLERQSELAEKMKADRALAQRCREWLESGGASFESLVAGVPVAKTGGGYTTTQSPAEEGRQAAAGMFGNGGR